jgi:hypothetical protein
MMGDSIKIVLLKKSKFDSLTLKDNVARKGKKDLIAHFK